VVVRHKRLIVFERKQHKNVFSFGHKITFFYYSFATPSFEFTVYQ